MCMEQMLDDKAALNVQIPLKLWFGWQDEIFESYSEGFFIETMTLKFNSLKKNPDIKGACYLISFVTLLLATYSTLVCFGQRRNSRLLVFF